MFSGKDCSAAPNSLSIYYIVKIELSRSLPYEVGMKHTTKLIISSLLSLLAVASLPPVAEARVAAGATEVVLCARELIKVESGIVDSVDEQARAGLAGELVFNAAVTRNEVGELENLLAVCDIALREPAKSNELEIWRKKIGSATPVHVLGILRGRFGTKVLHWVNALRSQRNYGSAVAKCRSAGPEITLGLFGAVSAEAQVAYCHGNEGTAWVEAMVSGGYGFGAGLNITLTEGFDRPYNLVFSDLISGDPAPYMTDAIGLAIGIGVEAENTWELGPRINPSIGLGAFYVVSKGVRVKVLPVGNRDRRILRKIRKNVRRDPPIWLGLAPGGVAIVPPLQ